MIQYNFFENKGFSHKEQKLVTAFNSYLETTANKEIIVFTSKESKYGQEIHIPYKTRWSNSYKKQTITKMYSVQEYITRQNKSPIITLLTLTGYQDGTTSVLTKGKTTSREELFTELKTGWRHLSNLLAKICPNLEYLWIFEPHKSGYPHIHIAIFGYIPPDIQTRLTNLWTEKYTVGSKKHGINFQVKSVKESIKSIKNYLLKYITKSIGSNGRKSWSPEEFLYHAIAWKNHHRYIGMSHSISRYCTARRLRYRYAKHLANLCEQYTQLPTLPTDKNGLIQAINDYKQFPDVGPPDPLTPKWHYSFCINKGTLSKIHHTGTPSHDIINWINHQLSQILKYNDQFIQIPQNNQR